MPCSATTKAGNPCKNGALAGHKTCIAHASRKIKDSLDFGTPQEQAGRPKNPRVIDILRERIEARMDEVIDVYLESMGASTKVKVGHGEDAEIIDIPDYAMRLKAVEAMNDRAYGKPRQEITGSEGGPISLDVTGAAIVNDPEARKHAGSLRRRIASSRKVQSGRARSSG